MERRSSFAGAERLCALAERIDPLNAIAAHGRRRLRARRADANRHFRFVAIGTTGLCNASCIHCPTGKAATDHVPRTPMDMMLYRQTIDEIFERGWTVESISFGLFGDGLVDPHVVERARHLRARLPEIMLSVNTNGAAFDVRRHAPLAPLVTLLSLHCESIRPDTYDRLMTPLRAANVFPKWKPILEAFAGKVRVTIPVSRLNLPDLDETRDWFLRHGAREVVFDPLASRCAKDRTTFDRLALAPVPIACTAEIMADAIIDCDGTILACCQDFGRHEAVGNVAIDGFANALEDARRQVFEARLDAGLHADIATCSRCFGDIRTPAFPYDLLAR